MISAAVVTGYPVMVTGYRKTMTFFFSKFLAITGHPLMVTGYCKTIANPVSIFDMVTGYQIWVTGYPAITVTNFVVSMLRFSHV